MSKDFYFILIMTNNNHINSIPNNSPVAELVIDAETVNYIREPPPPYSLGDRPVVNQPTIHQTIIVQTPLKDRPMFCYCVNCREQVLTRVEYVNTRKTHMLAGFICGCTFWCMLCCLAVIPYMVPTLKKTKHYCPNCNNFLQE